MITFTLFALKIYIYYYKKKKKDLDPRQMCHES